MISFDFQKFTFQSNLIAYNTLSEEYKLWRDHLAHLPISLMTRLYHLLPPLCPFHLQTCPKPVWKEKIEELTYRKLQLEVEYLGLKIKRIKGKSENINVQLILQENVMCIYWASVKISIRLNYHVNYEIFGFLKN